VVLHAPVRVGSSVRHSLSPRPLREAHADPRGSADAVAPPRRTEPAPPRAAREENAPDPVAQKTPGLSAPTELLQFDGASINDDVALFGYGLGITGPNGAVGPDHYFQTISIVFRIFDKSGNLLLGPLPTYTIWTGLGGICETDRPFGPVVKYDALADRWFISQDAFDNDDETRHQCIAVSTSGDPGGTWARYDFVIDPRASSTRFGIWPEAYYMAAYEYDENDVPGIGAYAFDRSAMLAGLPATFQYVDVGATHPNTVWGIPADLDGLVPPPAGSPNFILALGADFIDGSPEDLVHVWKFHADFEDPESSTFEGPVDVPIAEFNGLDCGFEGFGPGCVPQRDSPQGLFAFPSVLMYRLAYRNFGDHESLVTNFTVDVDPGDPEHAAIRWFELRDPGGEPVVFQEGTYAPDDSYRFIGSIAMDINGNTALGYSKSDSTIHPSLGVTGRLDGDPPGTMGTETVFFEGPASQNPFFNGWARFDSLVVDPTDGCTFWFTGRYVGEPDPFEEYTRIGAFRFSSCTTGPSGSIEGTVTAVGTGLPIAGARVTAGASETTTDGSGHYRFATLPVGSYDMTASRYLYVTGSAAGIAVEEGETTTQDFALTTAPVVLLNGVVKDGSGGMWPLYAKVEISAAAPGFPGVTLHTDPVSGYYLTSLPAGDYTMEVAAVVPGYDPQVAEESLPAAAANHPLGIVKNFALLVSEACVAPGYSSVAEGLAESFDGGVLPPGWSIVNNSLDGGGPWTIAEGGDPCGMFPGNLTGGSGPYALVNSGCDGAVTDDTELISALIDLSSLSSAQIRFQDYFLDINYPAIADVDLSTDGGASWTNVLSQTTSANGLKVIDIPSAAGQPDVRVRFHYTGFFSWFWQVDDIVVGLAGCAAGTGGLVVGNVHDANTGAGLTGAAVSVLGGPPTTSFSTPDDPNQDDGLYILYAEAGVQTLEASLPGYAPQSQGTTVIPTSARRLDFNLAAGLLEAGPRPLSARLDPGASGELTLTLTNSGTAPAAFQISELDVPVAGSAASVPSGPFADPEKVALARARVPEGRTPSHFMGDLPALPHPVVAPPLAAGEIAASYPTGFGQTYGIAFDLQRGDFWVENDDDRRAYRFLTDGTNTGETIDNSSWVAFFVNDGTYQSRSDRLWFVNFGGEPCFYELDPAARVPTGSRICPDFGGFSIDGLAYDPVSDTFYFSDASGGSVYHIDASATVLDSAYVGLSISGLAYNPATGHLFALTNHPAGEGSDVYVLDARNGYAETGAFDITDGGSPVLTEFGSGGLEIDCAGNLWLIDFLTGTIYEAESGETGVCDVFDVPWLSEEPESGVVGPAAFHGAPSALPVTVTFDATLLTPGLRQAQLRFATDTPYALDPVPVDLTVRFLDVPDGSFAENYIYGAAGAGIMPGCGANNFCPGGSVTRADMAGYIERAIHGPEYVPPAYAGAFGDVQAGDYNADYIQGLFEDGITAGCGGGNFCPTQPNNRAQMSVFIVKAVEGSDFEPPPATGIFHDVPASDPFAPWIEYLYQLGVTAGCGDGNYCPTAAITNAQMAVFLVKAFQLPHL